MDIRPKAIKEGTFDFHREFFLSLLNDKDISDYLKGDKNKTVPFPLIFKRTGPYWHLSNKQALQVLKYLEEFGIVKIMPFVGVQLIGDIGD